MRQSVDFPETGIDLETAGDPKLKNLASNKNIQVKKFGATECEIWKGALKWFIFYLSKWVCSEFANKKLGFLIYTQVTKQYFQFHCAYCIENT